MRVRVRVRVDGGVRCASVVFPLMIKLRRLYRIDKSGSSAIGPQPVEPQLGLTLTTRPT